MTTTTTRGPNLPPESAACARSRAGDAEGGKKGGAKNLPTDQREQPRPRAAAPLAFGGLGGPTEKKEKREKKKPTGALCFFNKSGARSTLFILLQQQKRWENMPWASGRLGFAGSLWPPEPLRAVSLPQWPPFFSGARLEARIGAARPCGRAQVDRGSSLFFFARRDPATVAVGQT